MSVIIRLQNLPWSANALDIRQYFHGLSIPEGGVHIVGGELGDAFIAFSTDEDARQAFTRNNGKIKEIQITLMLSSRTEMQRVIEQARSQSYAAFMQTAAPTVVPMPAVVPAIVPVTTETKRDSKEKTEKRDGRRRSRSKSRDRRDRSRDRRRHRRSRSRSRDRKSRRRERSRSRGRSRSKERKSKDHRKRSEEPTSNATKKPVPEVWGKNKSIDISSLSNNPQPSTRLLGNFAIGLNQGKRSLENVNVGLHLQQNGGQFNNNNGRDSWAAPINFESNFQNNRNTNFRDRDDNNDQFQNRFQKNNISNRGGPNNINRHENDNCSIGLEPFYGGYGDVRRFFQGMFISSMGIKFINDLSGRSTGVVYVRFSNRKFKEEALSMNGELLNGITVTISHISDEEFEEATDRYNPRNNDNEMHDDNNSFKSRNITKYFNTTDLKNFSCLTIDDLPTYCKEQDILHIFSQHPLVALILTNKKRGGYIAYVKFSSSDVAKQALEEKAHHVVGGKPVTVKPCKDEEFDDINKKHEVNINSTKSEDLGTDCLSVSGLPEKINDKDIADFFSDIGVIPTKIHLMSNNLGFTGQAYCEFANNEEASRAARKNDTSLGNVTITVIPIKRDEMETVLGTTLPAPEQDLVAQTKEPEEKPFPRRPGALGLGNLPNFISPSNIGRPSFPSRNFDMRGGGGGPRFGPRGFGGARSRFGPPKDVFEDVPPGCTIFMKNVPYKANTNDILNFFDGFNHTNNVSRRYNPNNTPSDEAKIIFFEPDEASRAMRELQKAKIWDRQIFLRQE